MRFKHVNLVDAELSEYLERIGERPFHCCRRLRRISIPFKDDMMEDDDIFHLFKNCNNLSQVDLIGGIHKTISSLLLENWRNEMKDEIDRINQDLPNTAEWPGTGRNAKTEAIRQWMEGVLRRMKHYKSERYALLKDAMTLLELAHASKVWEQGTF